MNTSRWDILGVLQKWESHVVAVAAADCEQRKRLGRGEWWAKHSGSIVAVHIGLLDTRYCRLLERIPESANGIVWSKGKIGAKKDVIRISDVKALRAGLPA